MRKHSEFLGTLADSSQLIRLFHGPFFKGHQEPRILMVGRSNVGKSSLINALLKSKFARISNEPGKTRALHFYLWAEKKKILVDLPGYGYAKVAKQDRENWKNLIFDYLKFEDHLDRAMILMDARHGPSQMDLDATQFLRANRIPVSFVFSKWDTLKTQSERAFRQKEVSLVLRSLRLEREKIFWISSKTGAGVRQLIEDFI